MKVKIHYSRTDFVEIEIESKETIASLFIAFCRALEQQNNNKLEYFTTNPIFIFEEKWLEPVQSIESYGIKDSDHIEVTALHFTQDDPRPTVKHIPNEFICQLTGAVFLEPMLLPKGETAEREFLQGWFTTQNLCPFNRNPLTWDEITPNAKLQEKLQRFIQTYPIFQILITDKQYKHGDSVVAPQAYNGPVNPTADDLLAIRVGGGVQVGFFRGLRPLLSDLISIQRAGERLSAQMLVFDLQMQIYRYNVALINASFLVTITAMSILIARQFTLSARQQISDTPDTPAMSALSIFTQNANSEYRVREPLFVRHWQPHPNDQDRSWRAHHQSTLIHLVECGLTLVMALNEMTELNQFQLRVLKQFYTQGLSGSDLRNWRDHNNTNQFAIQHCWALDHSITDCYLSVDEAMEKIQGLSPQSAFELRQQVGEPDTSRQKNISFP